MALTINVLGVREDDTWCAIALEMSLRGNRETFEEALGELAGAIDAQISFATQHGNIDQVFIPAAPHYFKLYADLKRETMKRKLLARDTPGLPDYRVGHLPLPKPSPGTFTVAAS